MMSREQQEIDEWIMMLSAYHQNLSQKEATKMKDFKRRCDFIVADNGTLQQIDYNRNSPGEQ